MIPPKKLQEFYNLFSIIPMKVDGIIGVESIGKFKAVLLKECKVIATDKTVLPAANQFFLQQNGYPSIKVDGIFGKLSQQALEHWQDAQVSLGSCDNKLATCPFPSQNTVRQFYGEPGKHLIKMALPYAMRLAWQKDTIVTTMTLHEKVVASAQRAFAEIYAHYGISEIKRLGLDLFGGSYNDRLMKGSSTKLSMHAWGIAIDFDPERNQFRWGADKAQLAKSEYDKFWDIWEKRGWTSLGRKRNFDWMHVQAAGL